MQLKSVPFSLFRKIANALVKNALLHTSYGPENANQPLFSLPHKINWIFSCSLPNLKQNQTARPVCARNPSLTHV
jgi:hypothetical protein